MPEWICTLTFFLKEENLITTKLWRMMSKLYSRIELYKHLVFRFNTLLFNSFAHIFQQTSIVQVSWKLGEIEEMEEQMPLVYSNALWLLMKNEWSKHAALLYALVYRNTHVFENDLSYVRFYV